MGFLEDMMAAMGGQQQQPDQALANEYRNRMMMAMGQSFGTADPFNRMDVMNQGLQGAMQWREQQMAQQAAARQAQMQKMIEMAKWQQEQQLKQDAEKRLRDRLNADIENDTRDDDFRDTEYEELDRPESKSLIKSREDASVAERDRIAIARSQLDVAKGNLAEARRSNNMDEQIRIMGQIADLEAKIVDAQKSTGSDYKVNPATVVSQVAREQSTRLDDPYSESTMTPDERNAELRATAQSRMGVMQEMMGGGSGMPQIDTSGLSGVAGDFRSMMGGGPPQQQQPPPLAFSSGVPPQPDTGVGDRADSIMQGSIRDSSLLTEDDPFDTGATPNLGERQIAKQMPEEDIAAVKDRLIQLMNSDESQLAPAFDELMQKIADQYGEIEAVRVEKILTGR